MRIKLAFVAILLFACAEFSQVFSWSKADDIPIEELPAGVHAVLDAYVNILKTSPSVEAAADAMATIAGGSLVDADGKVSRNTRQFGLKKDLRNFRHYAWPIRITRVNKTVSRGDGYGAQKIAGDRYTIWIAKDDPAKGLPAPVTIIAPEGQAPKVVNVGSF